MKEKTAAVLGAITKRLSPVLDYGVLQPNTSPAQGEGCEVLIGNQLGFARAGLNPADCAM